MKKMKKILAFLMAMVMVLGMTVTTFAAEDTKPATGTDADTGKISIENVDANATVIAYQIVKAQYERENDTFSGYADVYDIKDADGNPVKFVSDTGEEILDGSINDANLAIVHAYLVNNGAASIDMPKQDDGTYSAEVPIGTYLVEIIGGDGKIYSNVVVSTQYVYEDGEYGVEDGKLLIQEGMSWAKVQEEPDVDKEIVEGDEPTKGNTVNAGDEVEYKITATIPSYTGEHPVYVVKDILDGLTYVKESLKVSVKDSDAEIAYRIQDAAGNDIEDSDITDTIILNFVSADGKYNLNDYANGKLVITYKATVNGNTTNMNETANTNGVTLEYTRNSNIDGDDPKENTPEKETKTYTFDLSGEITGDGSKSILNKTGEAGEDGKAVKLPGAVFELYQKEDGEKVGYTNTAMESTTLEDGTKVTYVTSDENGQLIIKGLAAGTYYLKEVTAPNGYSLSDHEYTIVVTASVDEKTGELLDWNITVDESKIFAVEKGAVTTEAATDGYSIPNTKLANLPSTGGIGTTIFTIGGCIIMIVAAGLFFATRRKSTK